MDSTSNAERAADIVNARLATVEGLVSAVELRPWLAERVTAADLRPHRSVQGGLAALVDASSEGHEAVGVQVLNRLLARNPLRPRVSGHDEGATVAEKLTSEARMGLGRHASPTCTRANVDTPANSSGRVCASRCSTRENVAALRQRRAVEVHR